MNRYAAEHSLERRPQPGQVRKLDMIDMNDVGERILDNPFSNAASVGREYGVHRDTIRKVWNDMGLFNQVAARKPLLTEAQREQRMGYALENVNRDWSKVIFSDEKVFQTDDYRKKLVYRPKNTRFDESYIQTTRRSGRICAGIWAWIGLHGPGELTMISGRLNSVGYVEILDEILEETIKISYGGLGNIVFMQVSISTTLILNTDIYYKKHFAFRTIILFTHRDTPDNGSIDIRNWS